MVTEFYGSKILGERLMRARLAAGFDTAVAAAAAHRWSGGTYANLEQGRRALNGDRAKEVARAFGVPARWLTDERVSLDAIESDIPVAKRRLLEAGPLSEIAGLLAIEQKRDPGPRHLRLRAARHMAGLTSVAEAANALGVVRTTYGAQENGVRGLSPQQGRFYAVALGVAERWLMDAEGPSGLPTCQGWPEERWHGDISNLANAPLPNRDRLASADVLRQAKRIVDLKAAIPRSVDETVTIPEVLVEGAAQFVTGGEWSVPHSALLRLGIDENAALVTVLVEHSSGGPVEPGDYAIVDISLPDGLVGNWVVGNHGRGMGVMPRAEASTGPARLGIVRARLLGALH